MDVDCNECDLTFDDNMNVDELAKLSSEDKVYHLSDFMSPGQSAVSCFESFIYFSDCNLTVPNYSKSRNYGTARVSRRILVTCDS